MPMGSSFYVEIDKSKASWSLIGITFVSESVYEIRIPFESQNASLIPIQIIHIAIPLLQPVILSRDIPLVNGCLCLF
jgi:hypothetical protein